MKPKSLQRFHFFFCDLKLRENFLLQTKNTQNHFNCYSMLSKKLKCYFLCESVWDPYGSAKIRCLQQKFLLEFFEFLSYDAGIGAYYISTMRHRRWQRGLTKVAVRNFSENQRFLGTVTWEPRTGTETVRILDESKNRFITDHGSWTDPDSTENSEVMYRFLKKFLLANPFNFYSFFPLY